jgi:hypothetical protein
MKYQKQEFKDIDSSKGSLINILVNFQIQILQIISNINFITANEQYNIH